MGDFLILEGHWPEDTDLFDEDVGRMLLASNVEIL